MSRNYSKYVRNEDKFYLNFVCSFQPIALPFSPHQKYFHLFFDFQISQILSKDSCTNDSMWCDLKWTSPLSSKKSMNLKRENSHSKALVIDRREILSNNVSIAVIFRVFSMKSWNVYLHQNPASETWSDEWEERKTFIVFLIRSDTREHDNQVFRKLSTNFTSDPKHELFILLTNNKKVKFFFECVLNSTTYDEHGTHK